MLAVLRPFPPVPALAAGLAVALAGHDVRSAVVRLPQRRSLIDQRVFTASPALGFARFGVEYGSGVRTYLPSTAPYAAALLLLLAADGALPGLLAGVAFGLGRAVAPVQAALADERQWSRDLAAAHRWLERAGSLTVAGVAVLLAARSVR